MEKLLRKTKENPKADRKPRDVRTAARRRGLKLRQGRTGHAVLTNARGRHPAIPMHKPVKPSYIERLVKPIEDER